MSAMVQSRFADVYKDTVLAVNFVDARSHFHRALFDIHLAHTLMLVRQRILTDADGAACLSAILSLEEAEGFDIEYSGEYEDYFFFIERRLTEFAHADTVGKIHTARSRNDIDLTLYRLRTRDELLSLIELLNIFRATLLELVQSHRRTLMPAYTHGQPAQPTTLAHYLLAMVEGLERSHRRLRAAYSTVNRSPMGACAITTTGFAIDRPFVADLLAFDGLQLNSYGAIASIDYLTEAIAAVAVLSIDIGRFVQDLLVMTTREVGTLRLADGFVQISSIMPQKRNPSSLEHCRALASKALGECQAITIALHNTPFADMVDGEDDLQPLVFQTFSDTSRVIRLVTAVLQSAEFDVELLRKHASQNFLTVTELADTLVREGGLSFHAAHELVSAAVRSSETADDAPRFIAKLMEQATRRFGQPLSIPTEVLIASLDPDNFVSVRSRPGGPAEEPVNDQIRAARESLDIDVEWQQCTTQRLTSSTAALRNAAKEQIRVR